MRISQPSPRHLRPRSIAAVALGTLSALILHAPGARGQERTGPYVEDAAGPRVHAIVGARVVLEPGRVLPRATIVVRDGIITAVGSDVPVPADARTWNADSLIVYPGLIDPYLRVSRLTKEEKPAAVPDGPPNEPVDPGSGHPHPRVHPERSVTENLELTEEGLRELHRLGFTAAYLVPDRGIFRGRGAMLALRAGRAGELEIAAPRGQCLAYDTGVGTDGYPRSVMGVVALQRQTFLDAQHHLESMRIYESRRRVERPEQNRSLEALAGVLHGGEPILVEADDVLATLRAGRLAREFELAAILRGSGEEHVHMNEVRALGLPIIAPLAFPDPPYVEDELASEDVSLRSLWTWDRAPSNPRALLDAGLRVAFTTDRLRKLEFLPRMVRAAQSRGLTTDEALRAFTLEAARIHGVDDRLGSIAVGKIASFTVTDGDLFALGTSVRQVWVDGRPIAIGESESKRNRPFGLWRIETAPLAGEDGASDPAVALLDGSWLRVSGQGDSLVVLWRDAAGGLEIAGADVETTIASTDTLEVRWRENPTGLRRLFLHDAYLAPRVGSAEVAGTTLAIRAERRKGGEPTDDERKKDRTPAAPTPPAFVAGPLESPGEIVVRGATVWTCGPEGTLAEADLLVRDGRIAAVGPNLSAGSGARVIDAEGRHVTPGLMDCHSHSMIVGGVNEGTLASSAMVRIEDVLDSQTPNIYRQLAGGLTLANLLHGSANPIGGQNAVIKLRWGAAPDELLLQGAPGGIKFALGENVTQTSWGDAYTTRYPKSRMGVEQWLRDRFLTAAAYDEEWAAFDRLSSGEKSRTLPPRRDLELETLVEILKGERFIHCHSYRQDEILMFIRVAESLGFRIRTFQHILEGYKVADEMAAHGVMASAFSDWWAYKPEVYDAIPYAPAIMHERGVNVTLNSDSSELARRMNLEASKVVKYGGVDPVEALKMVTANVAIQLGVDDRLGTLEPGKDADFVLWSDDPLGSGSICLQTWIDGALYFDRDVDLARRDAIEAERRELLAKARSAGQPEESDAQGPPAPTSYEISEAAQYTCGHDHGDGANAAAGTVGHSERHGAWMGGGR